MMPWQPLPRIAFAIAIHPFQATSPVDLPLELGDELYIIEEGGRDGTWLRGYLVAPPSLLAGLTSTQGQSLEARVFSGIFPRNCVDVREVLGDHDDFSMVNHINGGAIHVSSNSTHQHSVSSIGSVERLGKHKRLSGSRAAELPENTVQKYKSDRRFSPLSIPVKRDAIRPKPQAPVPMLKIGDETPTFGSEPLVDEISSCLREWHSTNLHELLLARHYTLLDQMSDLFKQLDAARRQLLHGILTSHELYQLRQKTVWNLVRGNKLVQAGVIVRDPHDCGRILINNDSAIKVSKLQSIMSLLEDDSEVLPDTNTSAHLLLEIKSFASASTEATSLSFRLVTRDNQHVRDLSETYSIEAPSSSSFPGSARPGRKTLFTELGSGDYGNMPSSNTDLFLVVTVQQVQKTQQTNNFNIVSSKQDMVPRGEAMSILSLPDKDVQPIASKPTRRSMMWSKSGQNSRAKHPPLSKGSFSVDRADDRKSRDGRRSKDGRPSTMGSVGTMCPPDSASYDAKISRTIGVGAIKLNDVMKVDSIAERVIDIWAPLRSSEEARSGYEGLDNIDVIDYIMPSPSGRYEKSRKAERLQVSLLPLAGSDAIELVKKTPTVLCDAVLTNRMGFEGAPVRARSDIYITFDNVFLPKHALLSRPVGSATPISSSFVGDNLQVIMEVRRASGERIENAIYRSSSDMDGCSSWESTAIQRGNTWHQTLRLAISPEDVQTSHLVMLLSDAPFEPFALCYLPLWNKQAFLKDGLHSLLLYRYDESTVMPLPDSSGKGGYLSLPWECRKKANGPKGESAGGSMAAMHLYTYLCSTQLSQDSVLVGLLKWKERGVGDIPTLLRQLIFVPEIEIVKLLPEVFDALFGILVEYSGNDELEDLVFGCIVTVLGIVHDRRFNLIPLVDAYTEMTFDFPFTTPCLVRSLTRLLADPSHPEISRNLRATFKVTKHILKFINRAREQQKIKEAGIGITSTSPGFSRSLCNFFKALDGLMKNTTSSLVGSQTLAVQHFHTWLPELTNMLTSDEILHVALNFMEACSDVQGKLILYKLILIINYVKLEIFSSLENQSILTMNTVQWIAPYWGNKLARGDQARDQIRLCCSIVASQTDILDNAVRDHVPNIVASYLAMRAYTKRDNKRLSLLFPATYPFPTRSVDDVQAWDESLIELAAVLSMLSVLPQGLQLEATSSDLATILSEIMYMQLSVLEGEAFPTTWLSIHLYHHRSILRILRYIAGYLMDSFLPSPDDDDVQYDTELWKIFFTVLLRLVGSDAIALETFPEQRRRTAWKIAGDIREEGAELLRDTWEAIGWETSAEDKHRYCIDRMGGYQVQFVPGLVGSVVELCLSVHEGLRRVAVEILHTMIVSEWTLGEDLAIIQTEMIDSLDRLFKERVPPDTALRKLFIEELVLLFEPLETRPQDPLYHALKKFIDIIDEFIELLVAVHDKEPRGEVFHLVHRLRLMNFLRDMQKEEIFIRYVHQLAELQMSAGKYTEAGLTLQLHADLYDWDPNRTLAALGDPQFPPQTHFERKEQLYFKMIKHFEDAEAWSSALEAYRMLSQQYETNIFDFTKLARTQRAIASIYETVARGEGTALKYFKVSYRGMGFPEHIRNKEFIFESLPNERTAAFTDRMQAQHPNVQITTSDDVEDLEGQYLQVSPIGIHRDLEHIVYQRSKIPQYVRDYLSATRPKCFSTTIKRNIVGPVEDHWVEKIIYTTETPFPTILRRAEIVDTQAVRLSAIQTALERVLRKTYEMAVVEHKVQSGNEDQIPLLIDALSVSVTASADSSIVRYRDLLPSKRETMEEAADDDISALRHQDFSMSTLENALRVALIDHAFMIKRCLAMFGTSTNAQARYSHDDLSQNFETNFAPELSVLSTPQLDRAMTISPLHINHSRHGSAPRSLSKTIPQSTTSGTIATVSTSMLDTPSHRAASRSHRLTRLSFLSVTKRIRSEDNQIVPPSGPPVSYRPKDRYNVEINGRSITDNTAVNTNHSSAHLHQPDLEPTRHVFEAVAGNQGNVQHTISGTNHIRSQSSHQQENTINDGNEGDWVTDVGSEVDRGIGVTNKMHENSVGKCRTTSNASVTTTQSFSTNDAVKPATTAMMGKTNGNGVRKRLSMFRLGGGGEKKGSKVNVVGVGRVVEE